MTATAPAPGSPNSRPRSVDVTSPRTTTSADATSSASVATRGRVRRHRHRLQLDGRGGGGRRPLVVTGQPDGADHREDDRDRGSDDRRGSHESPSLSLNPSVTPSSLATSVANSTFSAMADACAAATVSGSSNDAVAESGSAAIASDGRGGRLGEPLAGVGVGGLDQAEQPALLEDRGHALVGRAVLGQAEARRTVGPGRRQLVGGGRLRERPQTLIVDLGDAEDHLVRQRVQARLRVAVHPGHELVAVPAGPVVQDLRAGRPGDARSPT